MYAAARVEKMSLIGANGLTCRSIQGSVCSPSKSAGAPARIHRGGGGGGGHHHHHYHNHHHYHHHHHHRRRISHVFCKATAESADQVQSTDSGPWPLKYGAHAEQGPREGMEDMFTVVPEGRCDYFYAGVFDGHSGKAAAEILASEMYSVFENILDNLPASECSISSKLCCPLNLQYPLEAAFEDADRKVLKKLVEMEHPDCLSGSTATVLLVDRKKINVANVGDSRAVLVRNGRPIDLSTEHRVYGKGEVVKREIDRIHSVGGWVQDGHVLGQLMVSRAFGDWEFKEGVETLLQELRDMGVQKAKDASITGPLITPTPDVTEITRTPEDEFIILASDGLWDTMTSRQSASFVSNELRSCTDPQIICEKLVKQAIKRRTQDNVIAVLVLLK